MTTYDLGASNALESRPGVSNQLVSTQTGWSSGSDGSVLSLWHLS